MKMGIKRKINNGMIYFALSFWLFCVGLILYILVNNSFKIQSESGLSFLSFPRRINFENYIGVINRAGFFVALINTFIFTLISIAVVTVFVPAVSYAINQTLHRFFSRFTLYYITAAMFVPFQIVALPLAMYMKKLGFDNKVSIIIIFITYPLIQGVFLCNGYLRTVPKELAESAYIEGAATWQTFFRVIYPIMKPMTATVVITNFLWIWNEFLISLMILGGDKRTLTLPLFIYSFKGQYSIEYNLLFAGIVLTAIPITAVYVFLQKYIIAGLTSGSVKG
jgi:raffinose/stachyose/melibiose transport system permease protein